MAPTDRSRYPESVRDAVGSIPWRVVAVDLLLVVVWVIVVSVIFAVTGWPTWLYYLVVFGGVLGYSLADPSWPGT